MPIVIDMTLDARTFARWSSAIQELKQEHTIPLTGVGILPQSVHALGAAIKVRAIDLLQHIGRACSRPAPPDDPSQLFALFRYATVITPSRGRMNLIRETGGLDPHKKNILSDEFGAGAAFLIANRAFDINVVLDVHDAIQKGWITTGAPRSRTPDYIAQSPSGLVVIEAKGTQSGDTYCVAQIRSGCDQVGRVRIAPTNATKIQSRLVVGISLRRDDHTKPSKIYIGDPEDEGVDEYHMPSNLSDVITRGHYARLAALIGDTVLWHSMVEDGLVTDDTAGGNSVIGIHGRQAVGSRIILRHARKEAGLFVGIDARVRQQLLAGDLNIHHVSAESRSEDQDISSVGSDGFMIAGWSDMRR